MRISTGPGLYYVALMGLGSLGLMAVLPFLQPYHALPATSFYSEWIAFVCGVGAWLIFLTRGFWNRPQIPVIALYLLGFIGVIAVQSLLRPPVYTAQALYPPLYLVWAITIMVVTVWLRETIGREKVLLALACFIFVGGMLQALAGLAQYLDTPGWLGWLVVNKASGNVSGNLGQANHFATQITLAAYALIYLRVARRLSLAVTVTMFALFAFVLALSGSRAVLLYLFAATGCSWLMARRPGQDIHRHAALLATTMLGLYLLALWLMPSLNAVLKGLAPDLAISPDHFSVQSAIDRGFTNGFHERFVEWHKVWQMFLQFPLLGIGFGQYGWHSFSLHALPEFIGDARLELYTHSHNLFAQLLAETGLVGLLLIVAMLAGWLRRFLMSRMDMQHWLVGVSLLTLFIHSNLEFPLWHSHYLGLAAILLAIMENRTIAIRFTPWLGQATAGIVLLLSAVILWFTLAGFHQLTRTNYLIFEAGPERTGELLRSASRNPLLTPWAEMTMATHGEPDRGIIDNQLALTRRVMQFQPDIHKVNLHIVYLALAGRHDEALDLLRRSATTYATRFPRYVCVFTQLPYDELQFLRDEAGRMLPEAPRCETPPRPAAKPPGGTGQRTLHKSSQNG